jgi:hypothetical protein
MTFRSNPANAWVRLTFGAALETTGVGRDSPLLVLPPAPSDSVGTIDFCHGGQSRPFYPSSKLAMEEWVEKGRVYPQSFRGRQLYQDMDELLAVQLEWERQVFYAVADLLNLEVDLIYFDTTSSYFEVDPSDTPEGESLRKQGGPKISVLIWFKSSLGWPSSRKRSPSTFVSDPAIRWI